jgi:hypothetical protein
MDNENINNVDDVVDKEIPVESNESSYQDLCGILMDDEL